MLIRFIVSNFLSFKDETEFNMLTGNYQRHPHHVYHLNHDVNVLKAAAIYGANGAGKSNLIKAIAFLKDLVTNKKKNVLSSLQKFKLEPEYASKPTRFEIEFETNGKTFSYGIECHQDRIAEEWLVQVGFDKSPDMVIFERKTDENNKHSLQLADKYLQTEKQRYFREFFEEQILKPDVPFVCSEQGDTFVEIVLFVNLIDKIDIIRADENIVVTWFGLIAYKNLREAINDIFETFDTGINDFVIESKEFEASSSDSSKKLYALFDDLKEIMNTGRTEIPNPLLNDEISNNFVNKRTFENIELNNGKLILKRLHSIHKNIKNEDIKFDIHEESDGSIRLLELLSLINGYLPIKDTLIFIDEIDRSIHPSLLKSLLKKMMEKTDSKGQLIFTTHEANLLDLDIFRQDEIWFAEKNNEGASTFYSLSDFNPRADLDIRKGYLNGRFGAIPFLANLENLNLNTADVQN
ncbi:MAG: hypothetical protein RLZZ306_3506 [Bacteroidota bacterium]|jgi:AAA15 family ATPase/GTPase